MVRRNIESCLHVELKQRAFKLKQRSFFIGERKQITYMVIWSRELSIYSEPKHITSYNDLKEGAFRPKTRFSDWHGLPWSPNRGISL